ncbi:hypothetical protein, partial [Nocardioides malaquae]|uniref:hypothetical protein n=1 Tax=Nocardioides malaquae TaxID=2773426 RepID=UPI001D0D4DCC
QLFENLSLLQNKITHYIHFSHLKTADYRVPRCELAELLFLKNLVLFLQIFDIYFSKQTFATQISASGGSLEQHILRRGSAAKHM